MSNKSKKIAVVERSTREEEHLREARYQGRWARLAGLTTNEGWAVWKQIARRDQFDGAVGWPSFLEAYWGADDAAPAF